MCGSKRPFEPTSGPCQLFWDELWLNPPGKVGCRSCALKECPAANPWSEPLIFVTFVGQLDREMDSAGGKAGWSLVQCCAAVIYHHCL